MLTNSRCMGLFRTAQSCRAICYCRETWVGPSAPNYLPWFFALCLSSALWLFACCDFDFNPRELSHTSLIFRSWTYLMIQMTSFFFLAVGWGRGRCQSPVNTWCESLCSVIFFSQLQQRHSATRRDHKLYHSPDTSEVSCLTDVLDHHPM